MYRKIQQIRGARAVNSSGCHRYGYWNEQCLFDGRADTGWCTPSRNAPTVEFLEIELPLNAPGIDLMRILSRRINEEAGFPIEFELSAKTSDGWASVLKARDTVNSIDCWHEWSFPSVQATGLKLEVNQVGRRPEGKYFMQFMCLELFSSLGN